MVSNRIPSVKKQKLLPFKKTPFSALFSLLGDGVYAKKLTNREKGEFDALWIQ
jgi:hypothetical protein